MQLINLQRVKLRIKFFLRYLPEVFKSVLFWPKIQTNEAKKRRSKDKIPVAISKQWYEYHLFKAIEKKKIEIEERKKKHQKKVMKKRKHKKKRD